MAKKEKDKKLKKRVLIYGEEEIIEKPNVDYQKYAELLRDYTMDSLHLCIEEFVRNHKGKGYDGYPLAKMLKAIIETYMGHFVQIILRDHKTVMSIEGNLDYLVINKEEAEDVDMKESIRFDIEQTYMFKDHYKKYTSCDKIILPYSI